MKIFTMMVVIVSMESQSFAVALKDSAQSKVIRKKQSARSVPLQEKKFAPQRRYAQVEPVQVQVIPTPPASMKNYDNSLKTIDVDYMNRKGTVASTLVGVEIANRKFSLRNIPGRRLSNERMGLIKSAVSSELDEQMHMALELTLGYTEAHAKSQSTAGVTRAKPILGMKIDENLSVASSIELGHEERVIQGKTSRSTDALMSISGQFKLPEFSLLGEVRFADFQIIRQAKGLQKIQSLSVMARSEIAPGLRGEVAATRHSSGSITQSKYAQMIWELQAKAEIDLDREMAVYAALNERKFMNLEAGDAVALKVGGKVVVDADLVVNAEIAQDFIYVRSAAHRDVLTGTAILLGAIQKF